MAQRQALLYKQRGYKVEIWKELNGHQDYMVSSYGRIKRIDTGKIYTGTINNKGYIRFDLSENGKRFVVFGHRAVAEAFLPPDNSRSLVNHKDGNKTNNHCENLEWCTSKENSRHAFDVLGIKPVNRIPVKCIETQTVYESSYEAARQLGVNAATITRCCKGQRHKTHGLHWEYADVV